MDVKYDDFFDDIPSEPQQKPVSPVEPADPVPPVEEEISAATETQETDETQTQETWQADEKEIPPVTLPLPAEDFDKDGKVKTVRKRMLKKLLKYEFRYLLPIVIGASVLLQVFAVFFGIQMRTLEKNETGWMVLSVILYLYGNLGLLLLAIGLPERRYNKNFFKNEGYVTFSIPASAEEHILAKKISAIAVMLISVAATLIGVLLAGTIIGGGAFYRGIGVIFKGLGVFYRYETAHSIFFTIEIVLLLLVGIPVIPSACGAAACFLQKYADKKRFATTFGLVFAIIIGSQAFSILLASTGFYQLLTTPVGIHIFLWLWILLEVGITAFCTWFELHTLKRKLNLK